LACGEKMTEAKVDKNAVTYMIDFQPVGRRSQCHGNESFLECARQFGVGINSVCGGSGKCHACKVQVLSGTASKPTPDELEALSSQKLESGWHLACQAYPLSNCKLDVPPESMTTPQRTQVEGLETKVQPEPLVQAYQLKLPRPSLNDSQADADRLLENLNRGYQLTCDKFDTGVLRILSSVLRSNDWQCQATIRKDEIVAAAPCPSRHLGLAVDLGTTKIAGYLVDLTNGQTLQAKGIMNPQISYGEDVISRITFVIKSPKKAEKLRNQVIGALNELTGALCAEHGVDPKEIVEAVVVGNTAIHHLFLGLPVRQIVLPPFVPSVCRALDIKARQVGLHIAPGAYVHTLPNIAGFVGADHVAVLLATEDIRTSGPVIAIDIGTNTEVSLIYRQTVTTTSCASGPVFEGGHVKGGMRAATGAIERLRIGKDIIQYQTIEDAQPVGICGSGIVDAMAQLYLAGVLDKGGRMHTNHPRVCQTNGKPYFVIVSQEERNGRSPIVITQHDVREVQKGKAAIRAGIRVLLEAKGLSEDDINQVIIAGAFGNYIDVASAITIGLFPSLPVDRFQQVGNAAGMGAKLALISASQRSKAQSIASSANYVELAGSSNFMPTFIQATYLGR